MKDFFIHSNKWKFMYTVKVRLSAIACKAVQF